ncbi:MAG TPA: magnesium transporter [Longimicrobiaceae bacterium]|nr:magnesium transporter [Longimicrobiaceae bacterium]
MTAPEALTADELQDVWPILSRDERAEGFQLLPADDADDFWLSLSTRDQAELLTELREGARRRWVRLLPPDDAADLVQELDHDDRAAIVELLDPVTRREVSALLAYEEDEAGGLMSPRFARLRPEQTVDEAIAYLRRQARRRLETIYYMYVLDAEQRLRGVVSFRELFASPGEALISEVMETELITVPEHMDQESVSLLLAESNLLAVPVVDAQWRLKGIVTVDDIVDVVQEEATEDIQKAGAVEALDAPYFDVGVPEMIRKRGVWLVVLFLSEMLTATAMTHYQDEVARAVVLATFIPLMISSGGNTGSQASTLVIRAMALGEVRLRDWWRVVRREFTTGLVLGLILALIGFVRVVVWHLTLDAYGPHYVQVALTVAASLVGIVLWGTIAGSMLPLFLRRVGLDPANSSAPFVATLVDVTGLMIYFSIARWVLGGTLL